MRARLAVLAVLLWPAIATADFRGHGGPVRAITISGFDDELLSAGFDQTVIRWSSSSQAALQVLRFHDGAVNALVALQGYRFASGGEDGRIAIWTSGQAVPDRVIDAHRAPIASLALSPDSKTLASASWDHTIQLTSLVGGPDRELIGHEANVNAVAFSPDGRAVISGGYDARLRIWPLHRPDPPLVIGLPAPIAALAVAPDGEIVVGAADGTVRVFGADGSEMRMVEAIPTPIIALALSPDGRTVAVGGLRGAVALLDRYNLKLKATLVGPGLPVWSIAFARDGATLFTGGADRIVRRWNPATGRPIEAIVPEVRELTADLPAERGEVVFRACRACHSTSAVDGHRAGPTLHGVFGRRIGTAPGYAYSKALSGMDIVWTAETIDRLFEIGPNAFTPGTKMPEQTITDPADRRALIEWLSFVTR